MAGRQVWPQALPSCWLNLSPLAWWFLLRAQIATRGRRVLPEPESASVERLETLQTSRKFLEQLWPATSAWPRFFSSKKFASMISCSKVYRAQPLSHRVVWRANWDSRAADNLSRAHNVCAHVRLNRILDPTRGPMRPKGVYERRFQQETGCHTGDEGKAFEIRRGRHARLG